MLRIKLLLILICFTFSCKKAKKHTVSKAEEKQIATPSKSKKEFKIGDKLDSLNGVYAYYNQSISNVSGRNLTKDGYNLGLKWQCVEFVKRYYYEHLHHKMPNAYGHAKDFYYAAITDGKLNSDRNLLQFSNGSISKPQVNDILVFDGNIFNKYGHVAIIADVDEGKIEIMQQNVGLTSRDDIKLQFKNEKWFLKDSSVLGWLRKAE